MYCSSENGRVNRIEVEALVNDIDSHYCLVYASYFRVVGVGTGYRT